MLQVANVKIPLDAERMSPVIIQALETGRYEKAKARLLPRMIEAGDRVLDLGGGMGVISALVALQRRAEQVVCVEGNPDMRPLIEATARLNDVEVLVRSALIASTPGQATAPFYVHRDLWASSPVRPPAERILRVLDMETVTPRALAEEYRSNLLIVDPEVMCSFLVLDQAAFDALWRDTLVGGPVTKLVIEFHQRHIAPAAVKRITDAVSACGFAYDPGLSQGQVVLFRRLA